MVYGNPDPSVLPQDVRVIFKNGDGQPFLNTLVVVVIAVIFLLPASRSSSRHVNPPDYWHHGQYLAARRARLEVCNTAATVSHTLPVYMYAYQLNEELILLTNALCMASKLVAYM